MPFHHAKAGDETDQRHAGNAAELRARALVRRPRAVLFGVRAAGDRDDVLRFYEPGREVLSANRFGHGDDEGRGVAIKPAVAGVRSHRLDDVPRAHERTRRGRETVRHRRQPVLLAAVHVDDVDVGERAHELSDVIDVGPRSQAAHEPECHGARHAFLARPVDHPPLGAGPAAERDLVRAPLQLARDAGGPIGVR
jgi:hypothetical protein